MDAVERISLLEDGGFWLDGNGSLLVGRGRVRGCTPGPKGPFLDPLLLQTN